MSTFKQIDTVLDLAEYFAENEELPASEEEVSEKFDENIAPGVIEKYGENDKPAMRQAFVDYVDSLQKNGELHESQAESYSYVGEYSE